MRAGDFDPDKYDEDDEIFVLTSFDNLAPATIMQWVTAALIAGVPDAKIEEAMACAIRMRQNPKARTPD